jgi:hypothetical protein
MYPVFLWKWSQGVLLLALLVFYCALLAHPAWRPWYERIAPIAFIVLSVGAFGYALRK